MTIAALAHRSPFDEPLSTAQILLSFRGRVPRKVFVLYGVLGPLLVSAIAEMLFGIAGVPERQSEWITTLLLLWPFAAVGAKRWHDRGHSGWWMLLYLIPVINIAALARNVSARGSRGPNRYGPDVTDAF